MKLFDVFIRIFLGCIMYMVTRETLPLNVCFLYSLEFLGSDCNIRSFSCYMLIATDCTASSVYHTVNKTDRKFDLNSTITNLTFVNFWQHDRRFDLFQ